MSCIFCKILKNEIGAKVIKENDHIIVIEDIAPKAPIHYLIIPRKHITDLRHIEDSDKDLSWEILKMARDLSNELPEPKAFNLLSNNGKEAGQTVAHMHFHFVSGRDIGQGKF